MAGGSALKKLKASIANKTKIDNPFDTKVSRNKRADALAKKQTVGKPGISKQAGEERRKLEWDAKMKRKNKSGGIFDKRFGEGNEKLTKEEKMLERFVKAKQAQAKRSSIYNLDDDDDNDNSGFNTLTHGGRSLVDDFDEDLDDDNLSDNNDNDDDFFSKKRNGDNFDNDNDNGNGENPDEPPRKKTKAEVMKEVMAKSKYYKHLRQKTHAETMDKVYELDDDFDGVMDDIAEANKQLPTQVEKKSEKDLEYERRVNEAKLDKKAAPSDRTKTQEEIDAEEAEKLKELEDQRKRRMEGEELEGDRGADDLDDAYWEANSDDEATGFTINNSDDEFVAGSGSDDDDDEDDDVEGDGSDETSSSRRDASKSKNTITIGNKVFTIKSSDNAVATVCPSTLDEFHKLIENVEFKNVRKVIIQVFQKYQPKLAEGNKEKLGAFSTVLLSYYLELVDNAPKDASENQNYVKLMEFLSKTTRDLATKYQEEFLLAYREIINDSQSRLEESLSGPLKLRKNSFPKASDLFMLAQAGRTFSTSDKFHLVVIPALVLSAEALESFDASIPKHIISGIFLVDILLKYQRVAHRVMPEIVSFIERAFLAVVPSPDTINVCKLQTISTQPVKTSLTLENTKIPTSIPLTHSITKLLKESESQSVTDQFKDTVLLQLLRILESVTIENWKECTSLPDILPTFIHILQHIIKNTTPTPNPLLINLITKLSNLQKIALQDRTPLTLQSHRALGIATYAPRFDESFNPDSKNSASGIVSDQIAVNAEISKLKHQIKQERKQALREIRKDSKFEARVKIDKEKSEKEAYHAKMKRIYNEIQAEEGTEKNAHEREKRNMKK